MSVYTLKRKTAEKYNNNSVGYKNFSLNGVYRAQGYVGQDNRGRTIIKTPYKGNTPVGHGGCCGKYRISIVKPSQVESVNNLSYIKSSVLSNYGSIETHFRWIGRPYPFTSVKPDSNLNLNPSQGQYVEQLRRETIYNVDNCVFQKNLNGLGKCSQIEGQPYFSSYRDYNLKQLYNPTTKQVGPIDQSLYILQYDNACSQINPMYEPFSVCGNPLPGN